jgi:hypothetical protein
MSWKMLAIRLFPIVLSIAVAVSCFAPFGPFTATGGWCYV